VPPPIAPVFFQVTSEPHKLLTFDCVVSCPAKTSTVYFCTFWDISSTLTVW